MPPPAGRCASASKHCSAVLLQVARCHLSTHRHSGVRRQAWYGTRHMKRLGTWQECGGRRASIVRSALSIAKDANCIAIGSRLLIQECDVRPNLLLLLHWVHGNGQERLVGGFWSALVCTEQCHCFAILSPKVPHEPNHLPSTLWSACSGSC
jgi:hypothetical protein